MVWARGPKKISHFTKSSSGVVLRSLDGVLLLCCWRSFLIYLGGVFAWVGACFVVLHITLLFVALLEPRFYVPRRFFACLSVSFLLQLYSTKDGKKKESCTALLERAHSEEKISHKRLICKVLILQTCQSAYFWLLDNVYKRMHDLDHHSLALEKSRSLLLCKATDVESFIRLSRSIFLYAS